MQLGEFCGNGGEAVPEKMGVDKRQVDVHADVGKGFNKNLGTQILAVDENAIAVKNNEGDFTQAGPSHTAVALKKPSV